MSEFYDPEKYYIGDYIPGNWQTYDKIQLAHYAQSGLRMIKLFREVLGENYTNSFQSEETFLRNVHNAKNTLRNSEKIIHQWKKLTDAIEKDPNLKDDWNTFLMVMKLDENEDDE